MGPGEKPIHLHVAELIRVCACRCSNLAEIPAEEKIHLPRILRLLCSILENSKLSEIEIPEIEHELEGVIGIYCRKDERINPNDEANVNEIRFDDFDAQTRITVLSLKLELERKRQESKKSS